MSYPSTVQYLHPNALIYKTCLKGRCLIAKKDIKRGTLLIIEDPFECVPYESSPNIDLKPTSGKYQFTPIEWSMIHAAKSSSFIGNASILASRCLAQARKNNLFQCWWDNIFYSKKCLSQSKLEELQACSSIVHRLLQYRNDPILSNIELEECEMALLKLYCNAFTIMDDFFRECGEALYLFSSCVNHSCKPNAIQRFEDNGRILIRSLEDISAGSEICISYCDAGRSTWWRRNELYKYGFICNCPKCIYGDPHEGYRCLHPNCMGLAQVDLFSDPKLQYQAWINSKYPVFTTFESGMNVTDLLPIGIPYGDLLISYLPSYTKRFNQANNTTISLLYPSTWNLVCSDCKHIVPFKQIIQYTETLVQKYQELENREIQCKEQARKYLIDCKQLIKICRMIIPSYYFTTFACLNLQLDAYRLINTYQTLPENQTYSEIQIIQTIQKNDVFRYQFKYIFFCFDLYQYKQKRYGDIHPISIIHKYQLIQEIYHICYDNINIGSQTILSCNDNREYTAGLIKIIRILLDQELNYLRAIEICFSTTHPIFASIVYTYDHLKQIKTEFKSILSF